MTRVARSRKPLQISDLREDPAYLAGDPLPRSAVDDAGTRTVIIVPMLRENELDEIACLRLSISARCASG